MTDTPDIRAQERSKFLEETGWSAATSSPLTGDASTRSYERLTLGGQQVLLMNAPLDKEAASCPPKATTAQRIDLGYNAMARLAGPNLNAFTSVAKALNAANLSAPKIVAANADVGFALIEDLGDDLFTSAIARGDDEKLLYQSAIEALVQLHGASIALPASDAYTMLEYDGVAMSAEVALLPEWYWPHKSGIGPAADLVQEYLDLWQTALSKLSIPHAPVLRDFHAENLLWLPNRKGPARVGIIDFQDALFGHAAYDLVSLLEDARRDVDVLFARDLLKLYCEKASDLEFFSEDQFRTDYAILGAQRNTKILGIFARLVHRDSKPKYASLIPRVEGHFKRNLQHIALKPLQDFFKKHFKELA